MPNNYVLLDRIELNATTASVTFDNIPQAGYTDLKIVVSSRTTKSSTYTGAYISFNGSTTNFSEKELYGIGSSAGSGGSSSSPGPGQTSGYVAGDTITANTFGNYEIYIPNYLSSSNKSFSTDSVVENNSSTANILTFTAGLWSNTAAINSVTLTPDTGSFVANSTFSLYGIAAVGTTPAIAPKANGGNVIGTDGTYWYHAFLSSGTFTPQTNLTCDYLVVAGGGGGGAADAGSTNYSGGGGAGGFRSTVTATGGGGSLESAIGVTSGTNYTITVGAGGTATSAVWTSGSSSTFSTITATGGGIGAGINSSPGWVAPGTGGSGGGGSEADTAGAAGTANQGYAGGTSPGGPSGNAGGGGGGAGAVGVNGSTNNGGAGGAGVAISAFATATGTGVSNFYAGGGGGSGSSTAGAGGSGGGGAGNATAGTVNTGGGGGSGSRSGAAGGSGIVIIRYTVA
jgi:hypothetical protein